MRKILGLIFSLFLTVSAHAGVSCSVPFNLTNGTTADASQVMANYNAILSCLSSSTAASGANSDITSLLGLTTPLSPTGGGTNIFVGTGTSTGTNTIVVSATTPSNFSYTGGYIVLFYAGGTNTGAATLNVNGLGAKTIVKKTIGGTTALTGNELVFGQLVLAQFDGTNFQIDPPQPTDIARLTVASQTVSGGATVTPLSHGTVSSGTTNIDCTARPLHYMINGGASTITMTASSSSCILMIQNNGSAGNITFSGFVTGSNTGAPLDTVITHTFLVSFVDVFSVPTYVIYALQ